MVSVIALHACRTYNKVRGGRVQIPPKAEISNSFFLNYSDSSNWVFMNSLMAKLSEFNVRLQKKTWIFLLSSYISCFYKLILGNKCCRSIRFLISLFRSYSQVWIEDGDPVWIFPCQFCFKYMEQNITDSIKILEVKSRPTSYGKIVPKNY